MKIVYNGIVKDTGIHIYNRRHFDKEVQGLIGKKIEISVQPKRKHRSLSQNSYYWAVIVPLIREGMHEVGCRLGIEEIHELLKTKFRIVEHVNQVTGEIMGSIGSTTDMTTTDMMGYFAEITQWAAEYLSSQIPEPNEQLKIEHT